MTRRFLIFLAILSASFAPASFAQEVDDELESFQQNLTRRLARHPYFSTIEYEFLWKHEPFVFVVQKPARVTPGYAEKVVAERLPILTALHDRFVEDLGRPLSLRLRPASPRLGVFFFATPGDWENYQRVVWKTTYRSMTSYYSAADRMFLLRENPFGGGPERTPWVYHCEVRQAARLILHGYGSSSETLPGPIWFQGGMADDLASHTRFEPDAFQEREPSPMGVRWIVSILHDAELRRVGLVPLPDLFGLSSLDEAVAACNRRSQEIRGKDINSTWAADLTITQLGLLCHYLRRQAAPEWRESMACFTEDAMKGKLDGRSFIEGTSEEELGELERALYEFIWKEHIRLWPEVPRNTAALTSFFAERWAPTAQPTFTDFGAESAIASITDPAIRVSLAIACVRAGDTDRALKILETLGEADARALRELARVRAWVLLRDEYLASLVGGKSKLSITWLGEPLSAKVGKLEAGVLHLGGNKRKVKSVPVREIDPVDLASLINRRSSGLSDRWARAYPLVIAYENKKARRPLAGDAPELASLVRDFEEDYPQRRESVEALEALVEVARLEPRDSIDSARRALECIQMLWSRCDTLDFVPPLKGDLRVSASRAYTSIFEKQGLSEALEGELTRLPDGRIRLRYDFEDPAQLHDWPLEEGPDELRKDAPELHRLKTLLDCEKGKLRLAGSASRRHVLGFEGEQVIRWKDITHQGPGGARDEYILQCLVMMCCKDDGSYVASINSNTMELNDTETGEFLNELTPVIHTHFDTEYQMELHHDGSETVTLWRDSNRDLEIPCGPRKKGGVRLWIHSDYVSEFEDLEIIGRITEESLAAFSVAWIAARVGEMGL